MKLVPNRQSPQHKARCGLTREYCLRSSLSVPPSKGDCQHSVGFFCGVLASGTASYQGFWVRIPLGDPDVRTTFTLIKFQ